ncbi:HTH-type transcriptional activator RhaS [Roseibaca ekhonensis]|uniref:HTH-type transcriptional activator RhaS n=1 Tax=Roseinatronobacter ekhonensis TaxID=254356 RepID=A0A3B0MAT2_9RHOB|nr:AraC family transcriptional regulator [Roseibaca ekhonensis]SUZ32971.1 HTH-type transcriptional activator RhaS [Roseibaca ekhonensis]
MAIFLIAPRFLHNTPDIASFGKLSRRCVLWLRGKELEMAMKSETLLDRVSSILDQAGLQQGALLHADSGIHMLRHEAPTGQNATVYRPLLCLILQGAKDVATGTKMLTVGAGQSLIVSHALPVLSRITQATLETPYIALVFPLDLDLLRSLAPAVLPLTDSRPSDPFSIHLCDTNEEIDDALRRYLGQCESDATRRLLAPITAREIHARLLLGPHGDTLNRLLWHGSTASRVFQATRVIQTHLAKPIVIKDLARGVGMSSSAFFEQFKAVTGTSPLQYQKDLRLLRARDELQTSSAKVSEIAFGVGYESSAQFSREYSRKFGRSPREDRELVLGR